MTIVGCTASEGGPLSWVADHRRHHAHSDEEGDTHTPHRGFFWAHMGWWMTVQEDTRHSPDYYQKWTPDLCKDPVHQWIDRYHFVFPLCCSERYTRLGGMPWLVWGGFVRSVFVLHSTWLVNSATHVWGYRSHSTRDESTNLWWVALLTYGEGWHNNHHAYQTSARHGLRWWEVDMTYITIRLMMMCRMAYNIRLPKIRSSAPVPAMVTIGVASGVDLVGS